MSSEEDKSQKTEDPTSKRMTDALEKGQILSSKEITYFAMMCASALISFGLGPWMADEFTNGLVPFLSQAHIYTAEGIDWLNITLQLSQTFGWIILLVFGILVATSIGSSIAQSGFHPSVEKVKLKWETLSPMAGLKKIFSANNGVESIKNILKFFVIGWVLYLVLEPEFHAIERFSDLAVTNLAQEMRRISLKIFTVILWFLVIMAGADYAYQRYSYYQSLRMSKTEVKDENKSTDGDPIVKSRLRQIRMDRARKRMMKAVPTASVVITNPTHYAVVLKYDHATMDAPVVVAKGIDFLALRIRDLATAHNVPILENPPLARELYAQVDIDQVLPPAFYEAVSAVIHYVMSIDRQRVGM